MPNLHTRETREPALGELLVLVDEQHDSLVEIAPRRGAHVTSFRVRGRELLYLETDTLIDPSKNVRGGIPVLFPAPGKLTDGRFMRDGQTGAMKQHGFARDLPWVTSTSSSSVASVELTLLASELTRAQFPWDFEAALTYTLAGACLTIGIEVRNTGQVALPFGFGLHPYFVVRDKQHARIDTRASKAFDNVTKSRVPFAGFDLTLPEVDTYLLDHGGAESALWLADGSRIEVRGSPEFTRWVVWTVAGKDYVCLEPWTSALDALNTGEQLLYVAPGAAYRGQVEIELVEAR
jgi:galactose mutarotase-like enzyme